MTRKEKQMKFKLDTDQTRHWPLNIRLNYITSVLAIIMRERERENQNKEKKLITSISVWNKTTIECADGTKEVASQNGTVTVVNCRLNCKSASPKMY